LGGLARRISVVGALAGALLVAPALAHISGPPALDPARIAAAQAALTSSQATEALRAQLQTLLAMPRQYTVSVVAPASRQARPGLAGSGGAARRGAAAIRPAAGLAAAPTAAPRPAQQAAGAGSPARAASEVAAASAGAWGCAAAVAYLAAHADPHFSIQCPGYAQGRQAMTCSDVAGVCPGVSEIVIAVPCPAAYENEAWNSWHIWTGPYDPYGSCSSRTVQTASPAPSSPGSPGPTASAAPPPAPSGTGTGTGPASADPAAKAPVGLAL
jgi:hypothetical protein